MSDARISQPGAELLLEALLTSVKDYAIFLLTEDGHIASWNAGAEAIKHYRADEIIGHHFSQFYTPDDRARGLPQRLLSTAADEGRVEDEGYRVRKDGTLFWADVVITAFRGADGALKGFVKLTRDLTRRHDAEAALRSSEASLAATLYSIGDGVIATDETGFVTRINPVAEKLTGWAQSAAFGEPISEVFHIVNEESRQPVTNPVTRVLAEGIVVGLANHTALIARDGSERPIADSGAPIRDTKGATLGAVLVFRDVTEERQAEELLRESEEKLRLMIASVRDYAIFMLDAEGYVTTWNRGAEVIKGYRADEIVGRHFSTFYPPEDLQKPARELEVARQVGRLEDEGWRLRKDGTRFWANVVISAIRDASGKLIGFTKVTRDMTERRRDAEKLHGAEQLAEREREKTARAEAAVRERDVFLSVAAHELRTPLAALQLKLQGLEQMVLEHPSTAEARAKRDQRVKSAVRQTRRLGELVERLLDVSRIAAGSLNVEPESVDLESLVLDVVKDFQERAKELGTEIRTTVSGDNCGTWDPRRLEQVVLNLLSNALKYGQGKPVDVHLEGLESSVRLSVQDRGIGIAPDDIGRIFHPFERAAPVEHYGGLGLGLHISRHIIEAHGGQIDVSSSPGAGARFVITLPKRHSAIPKENLPA